MELLINNNINEMNSCMCLVGAERWGILENDATVRPSTFR